MSKIKKISCIFLTIALLVGIALFFFIKRKKELKHLSLPIKKPVAVNVAKIKAGQLEIKVHYTGKLIPVKRAILSTKLSGYIFKINKNEGDNFKKGDILAEIDARDLKSKLRALNTELWAAENELIVREKIFLRNKKLLKYQAISKEAYELSSVSFEMAKAKVKSLEEQIKQIKIQLSYAFIRAPFSGVVLKKFKNQGDLAMPGAPIFEVENPVQGYKVMVQVSQEQLPLFKKGQKVYLSFGNKREVSKIFKVYPSLENNSLGTLEIRVKKRPFGLPTYSLLGVDIVLKAPKGFVLPVSALVRGKTSGVYIIKRDRIKFVPVKVLGEDEGKVVCRGYGLKKGQLVVIGDPGFLMRLYSGEKVYPMLNTLEKMER